MLRSAAAWHLQQRLVTNAIPAWHPRCQQQHSTAEQRMVCFPCWPSG